MLQTKVYEVSPIFMGATNFQPVNGIKSILITGGAGFIGSYVVRHFVIQYPEYKIVSFDKLDYCASTNNTNILEGLPNFTFERGDITDADRIFEVVKDHNIDTIIHFAGQSHVDYSFNNSMEFTKNNVVGTHVLLECARATKINRFIHVSTDEVYGEVEYGGDDLLETAVLCPTNPYAASKAAAEMIVQAYRKSFNIPIIIVRSNNVFGPHQYPEKIIPKFTCLIHRGLKMVLHGNGSPTRRYLFAGDAVDAFDTIFHKGVNGEVYNIGSRDEISNKDICRLLLTEFRIPKSEWSNWIEYSQDRPFNDTRYAIDDSKLQALGWKQKTSFDEGLRLTIKWYESFGNIWWGDISNVICFRPAANAQAKGPP